MKEKFEDVEMEVITFETEDIITTSGGLDPNEGEIDPSRP